MQLLHFCFGPSSASSCKAQAAQSGILILALALSLSPSRLPSSASSQASFPEAKQWDLPSWSVTFAVSLFCSSFWPFIKSLGLTSNTPDLMRSQQRLCCSISSDQPQFKMEPPNRPGIMAPSSLQMPPILNQATQRTRKMTTPTAKQPRRNSDS